MFDRDDSTSTALISFVLGGVAGAALAVLFAPLAGGDTRRRIGDSLREGATRTRLLARRGRAALDAARAGGSMAAPGNGQQAGQSERVPEPGLPSPSGPGSTPV